MDADMTRAESQIDLSGLTAHNVSKFHEMVGSVTESFKWYKVHTDSPDFMNFGLRPEDVQKIVNFQKQRLTWMHKYVGSTSAEAGREPRASEEKDELLDTSQDVIAESDSASDEEMAEGEKKDFVPSQAEPERRPRSASFHEKERVILRRLEKDTSNWIRRLIVLFREKYESYERGNMVRRPDMEAYRYMKDNGWMVKENSIGEIGESSAEIGSNAELKKFVIGLHRELVKGISYAKSGALPGFASSSRKQLIPTMSSVQVGPPCTLEKEVLQPKPTVNTRTNVAAEETKRS